MSGNEDHRRHCVFDNWALFFDPSDLSPSPTIDKATGSQEAKSPKGKSPISGSKFGSSKVRRRQRLETSAN